GITAYFTPVNNGVKNISGNDPALFIYPNPAKENAVITYWLNKTSIVKVKLVDVFGKEVMQIAAIEKQEAGNHSIEADIKNLSTGIYFVMMQTESSRSVVKFIKE